MNLVVEPGSAHVENQHQPTKKPVTIRLKPWRIYRCSLGNAPLEAHTWALQLFPVCITQFAGTAMKIG